MATVIKDPNARKRLQFVDGTGKRQTIHLGAMTMKQADAIRVRVAQLVTASITKIMDTEAADWAASLDDKMYTKLANKGVVPPRQHTKTTLTALMDAVFATLTVKPQTMVVYEQARTSLEAYLGKDRALESISCLDGANWRQWMKKKGLAEATISKRVKVARSAFKMGIRWKMMRENPLEGVRAGVQTNRSRMYFLSRADAEKVLEKCPDAEWRVIFSLSRFGGMRCPSEHLALRWSDIDWDKGRIIVRSQKTEHNANGGQRVLPLFAELRTPLLELFEQAAEGAEFVITKYRDPTVNLRTQFKRIIARAGLTPWPRLFHSLRGTRATELVEKYPLHVVCGWLGHTAAVASAHYLNVTDAHFEQALGGAGGAALQRVRGGSGGEGGPGKAGRDAGQPAADGANVASGPIVPGLPDQVAA